MPRTLQPSNLADVLPRGGVTLVQGGAAESLLLADAAEVLGAGEFVGAFLPGINKRTYGARKCPCASIKNSICEIHVFLEIF